MALPTISTFKANLGNNGGSARPNLFKVSIKNTPKTALSVTKDEEFLVKATSIPASTIATTGGVSYGGREIKYAGFRTFLVRIYSSFRYIYIRYSIRIWEWIE